MFYIQLYLIKLKVFFSKTVDGLQFVECRQFLFKFHIPIYMLCTPLFLLLFIKLAALYMLFVHIYKVSKLSGFLSFNFSQGIIQTENMLLINQVCFETFRVQVLCRAMLQFMLLICFVFSIVLLCFVCLCPVSSVPNVVIVSCLVCPMLSLSRV